jgi:Domain of unknown function (DUF6456)
MSLSARSEAVPARPSASDALDLLRQRKDASGQPWLGAAAHAAGQRLKADMTFAGMLPKVTMNWASASPMGRSPGGHGLNPTEAALAARQRAARALSAVGPEFAGLLIDVCGFEKGLEAIERDRNWPVRSAKVVVRLALQALARHYGMDEAAVGARSAGTVSWSAARSR